jgi:predicted phage baseplate assembly protein
MFAAAQEDDLAEAEATSEFVWEYASPRGWSALGVLDETLGFRRNGMISFIGPRDAVAVDGHGGPLYRLRARLKQGSRRRTAALAGIWGNAVWATQGQRFDQETLGTSDGAPRQGFRFPPQRVPVLQDEQIEVREWAGDGETWRTAVLGVPPQDLRIDRDPLSGSPRAVWVRYTVRPHLYRSGPQDRHYVLERSTGLLRFGDGRHGMIPPAGSAVRASYRSGGGARGNLPVAAIDELRAAIPYLAGVTNIAPATGGVETEPFWRVRGRGAERLRHRDRAISVTDVAWVAREASPEVARARCLPQVGPDGPHQRGWVSVLIVPAGEEPQPQPTPELLGRVREHLAARVPAQMHSWVRVLGPRYAPVDVVAEVTPIRAPEAAEVEARLLQRLGRFLHPLHGGPDAAGWEFGQPLYLSQVAALVEGTEGVDHVRRVAIQVSGEPVGDLAPIDPDVLIASGDHELKLLTGGDR